MNPFIVAKFGGTSMGNPDAIRKTAKILKDNSKIKLAVVSATSGTTNQLLSLYESILAKNHSDALEKGKLIQSKHHSIASALNASPKDLKLLERLYQELDQITSDLQNRLQTHADPSHKKFEAQALDQVLSIGERLSSHLLILALREIHIQAAVFDVRQVLITNDCFGKAEPEILEISKRSLTQLLPWMSQHTLTVTQGFIGATQSGLTTTLGRGGSDYSAALLAEGLEAEELQIWTDVAGIMTMDPQAVSGARVIPQMSFNEAAELANFGAKILHPATLWPAIRKNIRVFVGSTFQPQAGGTWIFPSLPENTQEDSQATETSSHSQIQNQPCVRAIALRKNQTLLTVTSLRMLNAHGFLAKLFGILARYHLSVDLVTTSEVSVALTIDGASLNSSGKGISEYSSLFKELKEFCDTKLEENLTLIAIVGNNLSRAVGLSSKIFNSVSQFNIRLICYGASNHNLCFLVNQSEALEVVNRLHRDLIPIDSGSKPSKIET